MSSGSPVRRRSCTARGRARGRLTHFGQVCEPDGQVAPFRVLICAVPAPLIHGMQALDGLFMAANREVLERVRFDEVTFDGFHGYDMDFSFSSHLAGFRLAVAA